MAERRDRRNLIAIVVAVVAAAGGAFGLAACGSSSSSPSEQTSALPSIPRPTAGAVLLVAGPFTHGTAVAGKPFVVQLGVTRKHATGPAPPNVRCPAHLGPGALAGSPSFTGSGAVCSWTLPSSAAKSKLAGQIVVPPHYAWPPSLRSASLNPSSTDVNVSDRARP